MFIDFLTYYSPATFEGMCQKALEIGLDGLVMMNAPCTIHSPRGLRIFPAQELPWIATVEVIDECEREQWIVRGALLGLLPENCWIKPEEYPLLELLDDIKSRGGASIGLYAPHPNEVRHYRTDDRYDYHFDGIQIKAGNSFNVYILHRSSRHMVAGSLARTPEDIGKEVTQYETSIGDVSGLISVVLDNESTQLYAMVEGRLIPISHTAEPPGIRIPPDLI